MSKFRALLEQRVHVQQVVLDGGAGNSPAGPSPQLTDSHGGLHFGVLDIVGLIQNYSGPGHSQQRWRVWRLVKQRGKNFFSFLSPHCTNTRVRSLPSPVEGERDNKQLCALNEGWMLESGLSYHVVRIFAGFLSIFLLDGDLFRNQAVCGHHHIMVSEPAGQTENGAYGSF